MLLRWSLFKSFTHPKYRLDVGSTWVRVNEIWTLWLTVVGKKLETPNLTMESLVKVYYKIQNKLNFTATKKRKLLLFSVRIRPVQMKWFCSHRACRRQWIKVLLKVEKFRTFLITSKFPFSFHDTTMKVCGSSNLKRPLNAEYPLQNSLF